MGKDLIEELEVVYTEQKRLDELEDLLRTMRSIAIEAATCGDKRRVQLQEQFHDLQARVTYLKAKKREPFRQSTTN
ncbi:hypothetical protein [Exiguobacterium alkaliphilum]|uniref:Transposase n=1 Tax=Exiguobacterium alkaliphilum TaxID=1428684 RepID=A0ABT2L0J5_9BACL|nr:hypothetical protein [Exiguobacterium alkaliphilum]MCT4796403.1 hypothetical protein [Exiguobacterium alkaliphilum]